MSGIQPWVGLIELVDDRRDVERSGERLGAFTTFVCSSSSARAFRAAAAAFARSQGWKLIGTSDVATADERGRRGELSYEVQELVAMVEADNRPRTIAEWSTYEVK